MGAGSVNPDGTVTSPDGTVTSPDGTVTGPDGSTTKPGGSSIVSTCVRGVPATSQLPRLTNAQYDNTIRDLVGLTTQPSSMLAPDTPGSVDQRAWDGYKAAADALAGQIMADANAKAKAITCTPSGDGTACATQFITDFGKKVFRRPLSAAEITRFQTLYTNRATITANGTFDEVAQVIIKSFLLSPSFLTRGQITENASGANYALSGYEVASRLSFMLWGSTPDDALLASAASGILDTSAGILTEAKRMILDPKARSKVAAFHELYAKMGQGTRWDAITRDPAIYPGFNAALVPVLSQEADKFFDSVVFDKGGTFQDLLTSTTGFVNAALAPIYGLSASAYGADLVPVEMDAALRPGIFTRAGFLTAYSLYDRSSPILRGAFLQKQILCTEIGSPPPGAASTMLPTAGLDTNRARTNAQTAGTECVSCHHTVINPTGYPLEAFDAIGQFQSTEHDTGADIDTSSDVLIGNNTVSVTGPAALMKAIAGSPEGQWCYAKRWVEYAYERNLTPQDACTVDDLSAKMTQSGYSVLNLITDLTQSDSFRFRAEVTQ